MKSRSVPYLIHGRVTVLVVGFVLVAIGPAPGQDLDRLSKQFEQYESAGRWREGEQLARQALATVTAQQDSKEIAYWSVLLGEALDKLGRYPEAADMFKQAIAIWERTSGPGQLALALDGLAYVYLHQGRYAEAEPLFKRAVALSEKAFSPHHDNLAFMLHDLANLYISQGRYAEAEPIHKRALAIREKALGPDHPLVARNLNNLASLYNYQGRYAEAEPLFKRSVVLQEKAYGPHHPELAFSQHNLANLYRVQGRYAEAEPHYKRALVIWEKQLGPEHPLVAGALSSIAMLYNDQGRHAEAEPLLERALAIQEKALGPNHLEVGIPLHGLAELNTAQGRYAEAKVRYERALAIQEKALGPEHPSVAHVLCSLALNCRKEGKDTEAESLLDRAIAILDRTGAAPRTRAESYSLRAQIAWNAGRRDDALADLRQALDLAEQQREHTSGASHERAESFGGFAAAFERMVAWQTELGSPSEAFQAIERGRARSLLDEIGMAGVDVQIGRSAAEIEHLRQRESELNSLIATLEKQRGQLAAVGQKPDADAIRRIDADLVKARTALYEHHRDAQSSSPVYRNLLSTGAGPPRLSQLQRKIPERALWLVYLFGQEHGYVLAVTAKQARVVALEVPEAEARELAIESGPLTSDRLQAALVGPKNNGVVPILADPAQSDALTSRLAALWRVLVPEAQRAAILDGKVERLVVIPDASLALLPFEALVVEPGESPRYLLDAGPAVAYGPSATILYNLGEHPAAAPAGDREPVLAVGDPAYPGTPAPRATDALASLTSRSRYGSSGGKLARLPYSGWEAQWVAKGYNDRGIRAGVLSGPTATEAGLRYWAPGRKVLHLACHGLADQNHGNFFGALALTPGPKGSADPADDGFLTLPEIYALNLKGCELTILSACQTNYGPQQQGEGTWALSRGFLVAGSRRVVASNWLVDDEAAASLVSIYCAALAQAEKEGKPVDHAAALQTARKWVRQQEKWKNPYYWASMVLVGPP